MPAADEPTMLLLVEDDQLLRTIAAETLREEGYRVIEASQSEEALERLADEPPVDVLLTDINMPGLDGVALAHRLADRYPGLKLILTSGRYFGAEDLPPGALFLPKPFTARQLLRIVGGDGTRSAA